MNAFEKIHISCTCFPTNVNPNIVTDAFLKAASRRDQGIFLRVSHSGLIVLTSQMQYKPPGYQAIKSHSIRGQDANEVM